jgi:ring-1,2-phenylacetyl-CoA epoxidase subunit PaaE
VAVKAIDGGRFSRYAQSDIQQGMALEVMVPQGHLATSRRPGVGPTTWRLPPAPGLRR